MSHIINPGLNTENCKKQLITLDKDILINILPYCDINTLLNFLYKYREISDILNLESVLSRLVINNNILSKGKPKKITSFADFVIEYYLRHDRSKLINSKISQLIWGINDNIDSISELYNEYLCESSEKKYQENEEKTIIFATLLCNDKKIQEFIRDKVSFFGLCQEAFEGNEEINRNFRFHYEGLLYYCAILGGQFKCADTLYNSLYISIIDTSKIICSSSNEEYWRWLIDVKMVNKRIIMNTALSLGNLKLAKFCNSDTGNEESARIINDDFEIILMLRNAVIGGNVDCFKYAKSLVNKNFKINYSELFSIAIKNGNVDMCQYLNKYKPEIQHTGELVSIINNNKLQSLIYLVRLINMKNDDLRKLLSMSKIYYNKSNFCIKWIELQLGYKQIQSKTPLIK